MVFLNSLFVFLTRSTVRFFGDERTIWTVIRINLDFCSVSTAFELFDFYLLDDLLALKLWISWDWTDCSARFDSWTRINNSPNIDNVFPNLSKHPLINPSNFLVCPVEQANRSSPYPRQAPQTAVHPPPDRPSNTP